MTGATTGAALPAGSLHGLSLVTDPAEGLQVTVRRTLAGAPLPEWRALAAAAGQPPFTGPDWVGAVHRHLGAGEPRLVLVRRDGRLLALGAFAVLGGARPLVTFLGAGGSDYATVLTAPDGEVARTRLAAAVLDAVATDVPEALFDLERIAADDPFLDVVDTWAAARGRSVRRLRQATVHAVALPASVAEHDAALGRRTRHEERRQWRRLTERGGATVVDDLLDGVHDLAEHDPVAADHRVAGLVAELAAVDADHPRAAVRRQPWTGASGRTLTDVLRRSPRGLVQLSGLRVDGELAAYALCLAGPRALHGYLQSYRARHATTGPGALLLLRLRRRALLAGYRELDLLRGDEEYKKRSPLSSRHTVRVLLQPTGRDPLPAVADRLALLRRTYRDQLRRDERVARGVDAAGARLAEVRLRLARRLDGTVLRPRAVADRLAQLPPDAGAVASRGLARTRGLLGRHRRRPRGG